MFAFHIRVLAKADIQEIVAFYDGHVPHITNIFLERLYQEFDGIKENPFLFQKKYRDTRVRYVKGFPFGIYYVVDEKSITILAVLHTSRNPRNLEKQIVTYSYCPLPVDRQS
tara:strand:- start:492 stop:827 length:336 start_codon:yes stop_codon:yes gene_type:complete